MRIFILYYFYSQSQFLYLYGIFFVFVGSRDCSNVFNAACSPAHFFVLFWIVAFHSPQGILPRNYAAGHNDQVKTC